jgi:hypothetical protein
MGPVLDAKASILLQRTNDSWSGWFGSKVPNNNNNNNICIFCHFFLAVKIN